MTAKPENESFPILCQVFLFHRPKIPDGYRLATEEDREGVKPDGYKYHFKGEWVLGGEPRHLRDSWSDLEYIVPVKQGPKVYTVERFFEGWRVITSPNDDFQPGDRVEVRKVSSGVEA